MWALFMFLCEYMNYGRFNRILNGTDCVSEHYLGSLPDLNLCDVHFALVVEDQELFKEGGGNA